MCRYREIQGVGRMEKHSVKHLWKRLNLTGLVIAGMFGWFPVFATGTRADAPDSQDAQVQQWVADLNNAQTAVQQEQQKLIGAGDAALPLLNAQLKMPLSAEQTANINAILDAISLNDLHNNLSNGPLVTLDADEVPAEQAFKTVLDQLKINYSTSSNPWLFRQNSIPPVTLHAHNAPYWQVMWALYQQTGISLSSFNQVGSGLQLTNNNQGYQLCPVYFHGVFALVLQSIQYNRSVNFNSPAPPVNQTFNIQMQLLAAPGWPLLQQNSSVDLSAAVDDLGHSLLLPPSPAPPQQPQYWGNQPVTQINLSAALNRVAGIGTRLVDLKGTAVVQILGVKHELTVDNLNQPNQILNIPGVAGVVITFEGLTQMSGNNYLLKYSATSPEGNNYGYNNGLVNPQMQQSQMIMNQLQSGTSFALLDANGQQLSFRGGGGGGGWGSLNYQYTFASDNNVGPPAKLVFTIYTRVVDTQVPFEFKNVLLP
jgi:hypothetical protein